MCGSTPNYVDGPAVVRVNIFVRSISKIDDVTMVSGKSSDNIELFRAAFIVCDKIDTI